MVAHLGDGDDGRAPPAGDAVRRDQPLDGALRRPGPQRGRDGEPGLIVTLAAVEEFEFTPDRLDRHAAGGVLGRQGQPGPAGHGNGAAAAGGIGRHGAAGLAREHGADAAQVEGLAEVGGRIQLDTEGRAGRRLRVERLLQVHGEAHGIALGAEPDRVGNGQVRLGQRDLDEGGLRVHATLARPGMQLGPAGLDVRPDLPADGDALPVLDDLDPALLALRVDVVEGKDRGARRLQVLQFVDRPARARHRLSPGGASVRAWARPHLRSARRGSAAVRGLRYRWRSGPPGRPPVCRIAPSAW